MFFISIPSTLGAETFANFALFREGLRRQKFYIDRFAKVYARKNFQFWSLGLKRADVSVLRKRGQLLLLFEC